MNKTIFVGVSVFLFLLTILAASATLTGETTSTFFFDPGDMVRVGVKLHNTGMTVETGIVEVQLRRKGVENPFAFIGGAGVCDPDHPENVAYDYVLQPGEVAEKYIVVNNVPELDYDVYLAHYDRCCTNGVDTYDCHAKEPWGPGKYMGTANFNSGDNEPVECSWDSQCDAVLADNCIDDQCVNNQCVCDEFDGCESGAVQRISCDDGTNPIIRDCQNGAWVNTGNVCPGSGGSGNPPPPPSSGGYVNSLTVVAAIAMGAGLGALGFFGGPILGTIGIVSGTIIGLVVGVMI